MSLQVCLCVSVCAPVLAVLPCEEKVVGHIGCKWQDWVLSPDGELWPGWTLSPGCPPEQSALGQALLTVASTLYSQWASEC